MGYVNSVNPPNINTGMPSFSVNVPDHASSLVTSRFSSAQGYANSIWETAKTILQGIRIDDFAINWEGFNWPVTVPVSDFGLSGLNITKPSDVELSEVIMDEIEFSAVEPVLGDIITTEMAIPSFTVEDPVISIPAPPEVDWPVLDYTPAQLSDIQIPSIPDIELPMIPQLSEVVIPAPPDINIPTMELELPAYDLIAPTNMFIYNEAMYDSNLKKLLTDKLYAKLMTGGTGLDPVAEQAIYDRATSRQTIEENQLIDESLSFFASRGFPLPPGALSGALADINQKILRAREDLNNDILVNQAKLTWEDTQKIIEMSLTLEQTVMNFVNSYQQRAYEVAKSTSDAAIAVFNAQVAGYAAKIEGYKAVAVVYESRAKVETAKAETYYAIIMGVKTSAEVQKVAIDAYTAQIQGLGLLLETYKTTMEGAKIQADIDRLKIENVRSLVDTYIARVGAITSQYQAYQAQLVGESTKADVYSKQVDAYSSRVGAAKAVADVDISRAQLEVTKLDAQVTLYKSKLEKYTTDAQVAAQKVDAEVKINTLGVQQYEVRVKTYTTELETLSRVFAARIDEVRAAADIKLKEAEIAVNEAIKKKELLLESTKSAATIAAQMAAAALSSVNASASISSSFSTGIQASYSHGVNYSQAASLSVDYQLSQMLQESHEYVE